MAKKYIPLYQLIEDWSEQSGELHEVIFTNMCQQDCQGRIPAGTFRLESNGVPVRPGDLSNLVSRMRMSVYQFLRNEAAEILSNVVVSKAGMAEYCDAYDVRPPRCAVGFGKWFARRNARFATPPPYPSTAEDFKEQQRRIEREQKAEFEAQQAWLVSDTDAKLRYLDSVLNNFGEEIAGGSSLAKHTWDFVHADKWRDNHKAIESNIAKIHDWNNAELLKNRLLDLGRTLEVLLRKTTGLLAGEPEDPKHSSAFSDAEVRRYLEGQVATDNWLPKPEHLERVRAQCNQGISERAFNRLWSEIVPPQWRNPGRRSRAPAPRMGQTDGNPALE